MSEYLYTTKIHASISPCEIGEQSLISLASLDDLKSLLPNNIDFDQNIDLMPVAFNAAVVNQFNKNDDVIETDTAIAFAKNFLHKPTNLEHDKEKIVGHIASAGFSTYPDNKIISSNKAAKLKEPFNIALGAIVYKSANMNFAELLQRSMDPEDSLYQKISASWEVGFSDYVVAVGNSLNESTIIDDIDEIQAIKPFLKAYKGKGINEKGERVRRLIRGTIYPLGIGFTTNPAADVKGLTGNTPTKKTVVINDNRDKKISQSNNIDVNFKNDNLMDAEKIISELKSLLVEKKFSEEAVASMTSTFADAIKQKDTEYREQVEAAEQAKKDLEKEREELKASVENLTKQFSEAQEKISQFEAERKAEQAVATFNERMEVLDQKFDLDDEDRSFLAKELKEVDVNEEAFASFASKLEVLWKAKTKEAKAAFDKEVQAKIDEALEKKVQETAKASENKNEEQILDGAKSSEEAIANNNEATAQTETLREKFAKALNKENIIIS